MDVTFAILLWGVRLAFLAFLYLFLIRAFGALHRSLGDERVAVAARAIGLAVLVVTKSHPGGPRVGERLPLRAVTSVGRDAGSDVVLNDEAASAKHAVLSFADGEWWLEDAASTNGTATTTPASARSSSASRYAAPCGSCSSTGCCAGGRRSS